MLKFLHDTSYFIFLALLGASWYIHSEGLDLTEADKARMNNLVIETGGDEYE